MIDIIDMKRMRAVKVVNNGNEIALFYMGANTDEIAQEILELLAALNQECRIVREG